MLKIERLACLIVILALLVACGGAPNEAPTAAPVASATPAPSLMTPTVPPLPPPTVMPLPTQPPAVQVPPTQAPAGQTPATATSEATIPSTPPRTIALEVPLGGAVVSSPVVVRGRVSVTPFEATLRGRVYDAQGSVVGEGPIMLTTEMGQPGTFEGQISFQVGSEGPGRVEVAETSAKDGSVVVSAAVQVVLQGLPGGVGIEIPAAGEAATLPLHILARVGRAGDTITASLRWQDGTELVQSFATLAGEDGRGLIIDSLDWMNEGQPPQPPTQPATLELRDAGGAVLARQEVLLRSHDDPEVRQVTLYFVLGETVQPVQRTIIRTEGIGAATLRELLWGPPPLNLAGFETAIPTPIQVLGYPGREPDWGPRVTLRGLNIVDGVATADFSQEMRAYGGGSLRVMLIRQQIEQTLKQFDTVQEVRIAIEGETEAVLEP